MRQSRYENIHSSRSKSQRNGHIERLRQTKRIEFAEEQTKMILADTDFKICELKKQYQTIAAQNYSSDIDLTLQQLQTYTLSSLDTVDNLHCIDNYGSDSSFRLRSRSFNSYDRELRSSSSSSSCSSSERSLEYPPKKHNILCNPIQPSKNSDSQKTIALNVHCEQNLSQNKFFSLLDRTETFIVKVGKIHELCFTVSFNDNLSLLVAMKILNLDTFHSILEFRIQNQKTSFSSIVPYLQKQESDYVKQFMKQEQEKQSQGQQQTDNEDNLNSRLEDDAEDDISSKAHALSQLQFEALMKLAFANKDLQSISLAIPRHTSFLVARALSKIHKKKQHLLSQFECLSQGNLSSKELLDQLKKFPLLKKIKLSEIIPSDIASIASFNALLQKVDYLQVNFGEITHEAASLLEFKEEYDTLDITFKIDIITNPAILDVFLAAVSKIKQVRELKLTNTFQQDEYLRTVPDSSFRDLKILIKQLEINLGFAKQINYKQYLFFKRLSNIQVFQQLRIQTAANSIIQKSLCSLSTFPNINEIIIQQTEINALLSKFLSPQLMKDFQAFYTCDFSCVLKACSKAQTNNFIFDSSYCRVEKTSGKCAIHLNKNSSSIQLSSYRFKLNKIKNLNLSVKNIDNLMHFEQICRSIAKCKSLKKLNFYAQLSQPLLRLVQRDTLQTENANHCYSYFSQLSDLCELEKLELNLHVDQIILDSIAQLIANSNSLQNVTFNRTQLNQYNLDYSKLLNSLKRSKTVQKAKIFPNFQTVYVSKCFQKEWKNTMATSFTIPLCKLLESKKCRLQQIKITTPVSYKNGCVPLHRALLLNKNQTQLKMQNMHQKQEEYARQEDSQVTACINLKRISFGY